MPITILTWNIYHGNIPNYTIHNHPAATPAQRLAIIGSLCMNNNIDIICLQEVPQSILASNVLFGFLPNATPAYQSLNLIPNFFTNYSAIQAYSENSPNNPKWNNTSDGYLTIYRNNFTHVNSGYYQPNNFIDLIGNFTRPPIHIGLNSPSGNPINILNWHNQSDGVHASEAIIQLEALVHNVPANGDVAIVGDLNVRGSVNNMWYQYNPFPNFTQVYATYMNVADNQINGLDHVLVNSLQAASVIENLLNFTSDAYHYPIAVRW